jgi:hypothetical protein
MFGRWGESAVGGPGPGEARESAPPCVAERFPVRDVVRGRRSRAALPVPVKVPGDEP